ncbi:MAG: N-acetylglucosamine-6-phosphate deacetylase [Sphaerochaetaceae bacterium]|jgi:N-acetylglucosamine-6-phosphate deacetylase|nr:N-acetylglucosamine-6-phosphate deacetylase [Sphaerochaetaceae bacterium]MDD4218707.1 N-acetylglucosamine-6-phosphate deacetylase [Sphaerochaetaceae bacterium]MDY0372058.1 N-acetylglucosamine-6-phosphate deacetylase [Sphaerochaetaceae bacterium]
MSTTVLINGTVITGSIKIPDCGLFIDADGTIGDIFNMKRFQQKRFPASAEIIDVQGAFITPGFIDTHLHGIGGFGTDDASHTSILGMSERLADFGVTGFFPTIYTDKLENMLDAIRAVVKAIGDEKGAEILGIHVEGPFISEIRVGAQNPEGIQPVNFDVFNAIIEAGKGHVVCMTVAPELKGMRELALHASKKGIVLLAGHTNATYENIIEGMQVGILHSTHFFNAMSRLHHRNPGTVGAILIEQDMQCEVIADGVHVHKELVKLLLKDKQVRNVVLITDSLKPTKQEAGPMIINGELAVLAKDGAFHLADDPDTIMGSALTMLEGIKNLVTWEVPLESAIQMATANPARIYDLSQMGRLTPGYLANIVVFDDKFTLKGSFIRGKIIRDNFSR